MRNRIASFVPLMRAALVMDLELNEEGALGLEDPWQLMGAQEDE